MGKQLIMRQVDTPNMTTDSQQFLGIWHSSLTYSGYASVYGKIPTDGTISRLFAEIVLAPGAGNKWDFTLYINGAPTALTVEISGGADVQGSDIVHEIDVFQGDTWALSIFPDSNPTATTLKLSLVFEGVAEGESIHGGIAGGTLASYSPSTVYCPASGKWRTYTENDVKAPCPTDGAARDLFQYSADHDFIMIFRKNGANTALTCDTGAASSCSDLANLVDLAPGDLVNLVYSHDWDTYDDRIYPRYAWTFVADEDGEAPYFSSLADGNHGAGGPSYIELHNGFRSSGVEADKSEVGQGWTFMKLYAWFSVAPGAGENLTFKMRVEGADGNLTCSIQDAAQAANDTVNEDVIDDWDLIDLTVTGSGGCALGRTNTGLVGYKAPSVDVGMGAKSPILELMLAGVLD